MELEDGRSHEVTQICFISDEKLLNLLKLSLM